MHKGPNGAPSYVDIVWQHWWDAAREPQDEGGTSGGVCRAAGHRCPSKERATTSGSRSVARTSMRGLLAIWFLGVFSASCRWRSEVSVTPWLKLDCLGGYRWPHQTAHDRLVVRMNGDWTAVTATPTVSQLADGCVYAPYPGVLYCENRPPKQLRLPDGCSLAVSVDGLQMACAQWVERFDGPGPACSELRIWHYDVLEGRSVERVLSEGPSRACSCFSATLLGQDSSGRWLLESHRGVRSPLSKSCIFSERGLSLDLVFEGSQMEASREAAAVITRQLKEPLRCKTN